MDATDANALAEAQRIADSLPSTEDDLEAPTRDASELGTITPEVAADRVAEHWTNAARSLIMACALLVGSLKSFADVREKLETFLSRLVARRVLSENDVLTRLKANGKMSMLKKIGEHADTLLQPSFLPYLPAHFSLIYQICLTIEAGGADRTQRELAAHPDATRDDIVKIRAALTSPEVVTAPTPVMAIVDGSAAQLFALDLNAKEMRPFSNEYAEIDALQRCLRHPEAADDAGLVARVPIRLIGAFERALMPLLGFGSLDKLYLTASLGQPDITDRDVIAVAMRGKLRSQPLTFFSDDADSLDILALADLLFPDCAVKCQLFAQARTDGWSTFIGDENWNEKPSVR
jgi:hypothetical protein